MAWRDWLRFLQAVAQAYVQARLAGVPVAFSFTEKVGKRQLSITGEVDLSEPAMEVPASGSTDINRTLANAGVKDGEGGEDEGPTA